MPFHLFYFPSSYWFHFNFWMSVSISFCNEKIIIEHTVLKYLQQFDFIQQFLTNEISALKIFTDNALKNASYLISKATKSPFFHIILFSWDGNNNRIQLNFQPLNCWKYVHLTMVSQDQKNFTLQMNDVDFSLNGRCLKKTHVY